MVDINCDLQEGDEGHRGEGQGPGARPAPVHDPRQARLRGVLHPNQEVRRRDHPQGRREHRGPRLDQAAH